MILKVKTQWSFREYLCKDGKREKRKKKKKNSQDWLDYAEGILAMFRASFKKQNFVNTWVDVVVIHTNI